MIACRRGPRGAARRAAARRARARGRSRPGRRLRLVQPDGRPGPEDGVEADGLAARPPDGGPPDREVECCGEGQKRARQGDACADALVEPERYAEGDAARRENRRQDVRRRPVALLTRPDGHPRSAVDGLSRCSDHQHLHALADDVRPRPLASDLLRGALHVERAPEVGDRRRPGVVAQGSGHEACAPGRERESAPRRNAGRVSGRVGSGRDGRRVDAGRAADLLEFGEREAFPGRVALGGGPGGVGENAAGLLFGETAHGSGARAARRVGDGVQIAGSHVTEKRRIDSAGRCGHVGRTRR